MFSLNSAEAPLIVGRGTFQSESVDVHDPEHCLGCSLENLSLYHLSERVARRAREILVQLHRHDLGER